MVFEFDEMPIAQGDAEYVRINPKDVMDHLLMVWVIGYIPESPTRFTQPGQKSDVIVVDAVDLDQVDPDTNQYGLVGRKCWWRQAQLIRDLKGSIGKVNPKLVRMAKGQATKGMPPYVLLDVRSEQQCVLRANAWIQANPGFTPSVMEMALPQAAVPVQAPAPESALERLARQSTEEPWRKHTKEELSNVGLPSTLPNLPRPPLPDEPPF